MNICKTDDIIILDETRSFNYNIQNIKNAGGIFSNDYMFFSCCNKEFNTLLIKKDYATLLDHLKISHDMICLNCVENDLNNQTIKIQYKIKCKL